MYKVAEAVLELIQCVSLRILWQQWWILVVKPKTQSTPPIQSCLCWKAKPVTSFFEGKVTSRLVSFMRKFPSINSTTVLTNYYSNPHGSVLLFFFFQSN